MAEFVIFQILVWLVVGFNLGIIYARWKIVKNKRLNVCPRCQNVYFLDGKEECCACKHRYTQSV